MRRALLLLGAVLVGLCLYGARAEATIAASVLGQSQGSAAANSFTTSSITPVAGQLILVFMHATSFSDVGSALTGTNGLNVTWTLVTTQNGAGSAKHTAIFRGVAASSVAGTVTYSETTLSGTILWSAVTYSGVDLANTTQGVMQFVSSTACNPCTAQTVTIGTFRNEANATVAVSFTESNASYTAGSGFTGSSNSTVSGSEGVEFASSHVSPATNTWGSSVGSHVVAIELATTPAILWFSGVETGSAPTGVTGSTSEFTQFDNGSHHAVSTSVKRTGAYGLVLTQASSNGGFAISKKGLGLTTGYFRLWVNLEGLPLSASENNIARWFNAAQTIEGGVSVTSSGTLRFRYNGSTVTTGTTVLSTAIWYLIEGKFVVHASVGGLEVKLNGTTEFSSFATNTSAITALDQVQFGPAVNDATATTAFRYDDMMVCLGDYCPSGGTISRQGTAGTPTYDAWTKNSCTGGTIDGCWSDIPFNATSNASSSTASQAQTMLVASVLATQSGHGSDVMFTGTTINACKTTVVAKRVTASSFSIRRRLSGVDTDTPVTLVAGDAYFDDGIWTSTPTILSSAEIGGVHGSGSNAQTVEDAYLVCDFVSPSTQRKVYQD